MADGGLVPTVLELARYAGFDFVWHDEDSRKNAGGLVDVLLARFPKPGVAPRLIFAECKKDTGWDWSKRAGGAQRDVMLGMLELAAWPYAVSVDWIEVGRAMKPQASQAARSPMAAVRVEVYLWQPSMLETIKAILWDGSGKAPPL